MFLNDLVKITNIYISVVFVYFSPKISPPNQESEDSGMSLSFAVIRSELTNGSAANSSNKRISPSFSNGTGSGSGKYQNGSSNNSGNYKNGNSKYNNNSNSNNQSSNYSSNVKSGGTSNGHTSLENDDRMLGRSAFANNELFNGKSHNNKHNSGSGNSGSRNGNNQNNDHSGNSQTNNNSHHSGSNHHGIHTNNIHNKGSSSKNKNSNDIYKSTQNENSLSMIDTDNSNETDVITNQLREQDDRVNKMEYDFSQ